MTITRLLVLSAAVIFTVSIMLAVRKDGHAVVAVPQAQFYVSPSGDDNSEGTLEAPFQTWARAEQAAQAGDLIYFRGGYYRPQERIHLTKSGGKGERIRYQAYPGEVPVFDLSLIDSEIGGVEINADWLHISKMEFANSKHACIRVTVRKDAETSASHNILEQLNIHDCGNAGIVLWGNHRGDGGVHENLLLNIDSYRHYYPPERGNQGDGIVVGGGVGPGNEVRGCRAWDNADDGFDTWSAGSSVLFHNNWSMRNGFNIWGQKKPWEGAGHGFKLGMSVANDNHVLVHNVAVGNARWGFNDNKNTASMTFMHNTAFGNGVGQIRLAHGKHVARYNLAPLQGVSLAEEIIEETNSWNYPDLAVTAQDFVSVDLGLARHQRDRLGRLSTAGFFQLREDSEIRKTADVLLGFKASHQSLRKPAPAIASRE